MLPFKEHSSVLEQELSVLASELNQSLELRMQGPLTPNAVILVTGVGKLRTKRELFWATVASWFLGDSGYLIREQITEKIGNSGDFIEVELALLSKSHMLLILQEISSARSFFGNDLKFLRQLVARMTIVVRSPRPGKQKIRRRGYRDHGTLVPNDRWLPRSDWSLNKIQEEIDLQRQANQDTLDFIEGFLI